MNWEKKFDNWNKKLENMSNKFEKGDFSDVSKWGEKTLFKAVDTVDKYDKKRKKWKNRFGKVDRTVQRIDKAKSKFSSWFGGEGKFALNVEITRSSDRVFKVIHEEKKIFVIKKKMFSSEKNPIFVLKNKQSKEVIKISKAGFFTIHRTPFGKRPTLVVSGNSLLGKVFSVAEIKNTYESTKDGWRIIGNRLTNDYKIERNAETIARSTGNIRNDSVIMNIHNGDYLNDVITMWTAAYIFDRYIINEGFNLRNID